MCFCCLSCAFSFQSIGRDNTFRLINANQPADLHLRLQQMQLRMVTMH